jgi:hypothetical protein
MPFPSPSAVGDPSRSSKDRASVYSADGARHLLRLAGPAVWAALGLVLITRIIAMFSWQHTTDDAYMFVRYADHVLNDACFCWNSPGAPTFGLTAAAYLVVVMPIRLLLPHATGMAILLSSVVSGIIYLIALAILLTRYSGVSRTSAGVIATFVLGALAFACGQFAYHFTSGMDTMFASACLAVFLSLLKARELHPGWRSSAAVGVASGLLFLVRPDLMIYAFLVPGTALLIARDRASRLDFLTILAVTTLTLGVELGLAKAYFGLPLPLPFYAKGMHSYTGNILNVYRYTSYIEFGTFVSNYWPVFVPILLVLPSCFRGSARPFTAVDAGVGVATLAFLVYYLFFVLQILSSHARFYMPTLPALFFLAARALVFLCDSSPWRERFDAVLASVVDRRPNVVRALLIPALAALATLMIFLAYKDVAAIKRIATGVAIFDPRARYLATEWDIWYRLDEISDLPDDVVLATTEVGVLSAMNPGKRILDLAGLNDTQVVRNGFQITKLLHDNYPDFMYMPHPDYSEMNRRLLEDPEFQNRYELFDASRLDSVMGVAVRKDSKYFPQLEAIALEGQRKLPRVHPYPYP